MRPVIHLSVVVPVLDEELSLPLLHAELRAALEHVPGPCEVIYVDDGSQDGSLAALLELRRQDARVRVIRLRSNCGQTAALAAGFDHARGAVVVTLDADLQNDPADIPRLLEELERGHDIVAGWRQQRHDGFVLRRLPSRLANHLIRLVTGVQIHDTGCTLKAFRKELVESLPIYAEQHRFLPAMSAGSGARVSEIVVGHRPRRFGHSKYGLGRALRVLADLLSIKLISSFSHRPIQYFGLLALPFALGLLAFLGSSLAAWRQISFENSWGRVVLIVFALTFMVCAYFLMLGLLAELAVKASGLHGPRARRILMTSLER